MNNNFYGFIVELIQEISAQFLITFYVITVIIIKSMIICIVETAVILSDQMWRDESKIDSFCILFQDANHNLHNQRAIV